MRPKRIHLVYPSGPQIGCPQAIGRHLAAGLSARYDVVLHDWDEPRPIVPQPGDVLLGHPHPSPWTVFRRSLKQDGWARILMMSPFCPTPRLAAWLDPLIRQVDEYLAITGPYWFEQTKRTPYRHWLPRMQHLDLAVDRREFPRVKKSFAAAGKRRFLYIGNLDWYKNIGFLRAIARAMPGVEFGWMGGKGDPAPLKALGRFDFAQAAARRRVADYDFLISVGRADANPATILEAMAWGLVPVCTPQCGYAGFEGIPNLPLDDVPGAVEVLRELQGASAARLQACVRANDRQLRAHFHWPRFVAQVEEAVSRRGRAELGLRPLKDLIAMRAGSLQGVNNPLRPRWAAKALLDRARTRPRSSNA